MVRENFCLACGHSVQSSSSKTKRLCSRQCNTTIKLFKKAYARLQKLRDAVSKAFVRYIEHLICSGKPIKHVFEQLKAFNQNKFAVSPSAKAYSTLELKDENQWTLICNVCHTIKNIADMKCQCKGAPKNMEMILAK